MKDLKFTDKEKLILILNQKDEINGYHIYKNLSNSAKKNQNARLFKRLSQDEKRHYEILRKYTGINIKPNFLNIIFFVLCAKILGFTFTLKILEKGEKNADSSYSRLKKKIKEVKNILKDEDVHEHDLLNLINEPKLKFMGSVVLGLNDALVELTGAMAGYTFAMQNNRLITMISLITGIAASLSMASSEFLSKRQEGEKKEAYISSLYTGCTYIITVILLILPFLILSNPFISLIITIIIAILIILFFNFYISIAKDLSFKKRFLEMAGISIGVALISFAIGWLVKKVMGVDI